MPLNKETKPNQLSASSIVILHLSSYRVALRPVVFTAAWIWPSVSWQLEISSSLRAPSNQAFTSFEGFGLLPRACGVPNKGNIDGAEDNFGHAGRVWALALRLDPPKKAVCHTCPFGGASNKIKQYRNTIVLAGVLVLRSRVRLPILDTIE